MCSSLYLIVFDCMVEVGILVEMDVYSLLVEPAMVMYHSVALTVVVVVVEMMVLPVVYWNRVRYKNYRQQVHGYVCLGGDERNIFGTRYCIITISRCGRRGIIMWLKDRRWWTTRTNCRRCGW